MFVYSVVDLVLIALLVILAAAITFFASLAFVFYVQDCIHMWCCKHESVSFIYFSGKNQCTSCGKVFKR